MSQGERLTLELLRAHGTAAALTGAGGTVSFAELALKAEDVAKRLRAAGAGAGTRVGIVSAGRSFDEPIALAGILAAGCTAVPLDSTAPPARLASILTQSRVSAVVHDAPEGDARSPDAALTQAEAALERRLARVVLASSGEVRDVRDGAGAAPVGADEGIACILHTSGSTGVPKPVPITWEGLWAFTSWASDLIALAGEDRVLRVAELVFDLAWFDHLATWRRGASLLLLSRRQLAAGKSALEAITQLEPTVIYGVPSLFMKLHAAGALPPAVRVVFFAGEVFPPRELAAFAASAPQARLFNLFGPTETNVCTFHAVDRAELDGATEIPIGVACPYAACELRGDDGAVIEGPGVGELWVTGPTAVFGGPFATRDRVERDARGLFHFRGRIDRMVKVRGYRVEPGDVEAALAAHPGLRRAAVVTRDDPRLGKILCAFVEPVPLPADVVPGQATSGETSSGKATSGDAPGETTPSVSPRPTERQVRAFAAERLPPYMVPDRVVFLDALPETTTGKIDYPALREAT